MQNRPNIVWIQTDEQRPDSLGCYGSDWAKTPNLDRLADQGILFQECHVQSPTCVPSRTSQLTCRYPQDINVYDNKYFYMDHILAPDVQTFPARFAGAGYRTCNIGKWHTPNIETWQEINAFQHFTHTGMHGLADTSKEAEHRVVKRIGGDPIILAGIYPQDRWGTTPSSHITDLSLRWLQEAAKDDVPFFLRVSHLWPHTPVLPPNPWHKLYLPDEIPYQLEEYKKTFHKRSQYDQALGKGQKGDEFPEETWRWIRQCYYGLCGQIDYQVGRLLHGLDVLGLKDNTIVVFSSDHGKNLGEFGCCEKSGFYHQVWKVPFIISGPGIDKGVGRTDLVEAMDLGPTLMALAGIHPSDGMGGRNLLDSAESEAVYGIIERGGRKDPARPYAPDIQGLRRIAVRTKKYKFDYTFSYAGARVSTTEDEYDGSLFDIENDPMELNNLAKEAEYQAIVEEMRREGEQWYIKHLKQ